MSFQSPLLVLGLRHSLSIRQFLFGSELGRTPVQALQAGLRVEPLDRVELLWIVIALVWCLIMFFMMPYWHVFGKQNLANEAYRNTPEAFSAKTQAMVDKYTVREETLG